MICPYKMDTGCLVALQMYHSPVMVTENACNVCQSDQKPRQVNQVTVSLAMSGAMRLGDKDVVEDLRTRHWDLLKKGPISTDAVERLQRILEGAGVGSQLWRLLGSIGIHHLPSCSCLEWAERMNTWGPNGCRLARKEIIDHMKESAKNYGWGDIAKAIIRAVASGLACRLSVIDPYGSLLDESISLAESSGSL